jgi:hypothetical protein
MQDDQAGQANKDLAQADAVRREVGAKRRVGMMRRLRGRILIAVACLLAAATPSRAQEPRTILNQKDWWVAGVCVGLDQCGFCTATDGVQDVLLRVEPPKEVSVTMPPDRPAAGVVLEIGPRSITLERGEGDSFQAVGRQAREIIQAMRHEANLTLRVTADPPMAYRYELADFPQAYAAILKSCPGSAGP